MTSIGKKIRFGAAGEKKEKNQKKFRRRLIRRTGKKNKNKKIKTKKMSTRAAAGRSGAIPPLPLPQKHESSAIEPVWIETVAAVAPARNRAAFSTLSTSSSTLFHGADVDGSNNSCGGAGAWLSADGVRGVAWEVEPEVSLILFSA